MLSHKHVIILTPLIGWWSPAGGTQSPRVAIFIAQRLSPFRSCGGAGGVWNYVSRILCSRGYRPTSAKCPASRHGVSRSRRHSDDVCNLALNDPLRLFCWAYKARRPSYYWWKSAKGLRNAWRKIDFSFVIISVLDGTTLMRRSSHIPRSVSPCLVYTPVWLFLIRQRSLHGLSGHRVFAASLTRAKMVIYKWYLCGSPSIPSLLWDRGV